MGLLFFLTLPLIFPSSVYAYLDPGSGSLLFQILLAGILGAAFTAKTYWQTLKRIVKRFFRKVLKSAEKER